jgi:hypothetical protein
LSEVWERRGATQLVQQAAQHALWVRDEVLEAKKQAALALVKEKHEHRDEMGKPQVGVRLQHSERRLERVGAAEGCDDAPRIADEEDEVQIDAAGALKLTRAEWIV